MTNNIQGLAEYPAFSTTEDQTKILIRQVITTTTLTILANCHNSCNHCYRNFANFLVLANFVLYFVLANFVLYFVLANFDPSILVLVPVVDSAMPVRRSVRSSRSPLPSPVLVPIGPALGLVLAEVFVLVLVPVLVLFVLTYLRRHLCLQRHQYRRHLLAPMLTRHRNTGFHLKSQIRRQPQRMAS